jgi:hypothetical protein
VKEGEGEEGTVACKYTQIVGKGVQKVQKSQLSVAIKLEDTIPRGSIHTEYFKYETSIVGCIQDAALLTVTQL